MDVAQRVALRQTVPRRTRLAALRAPTAVAALAFALRLTLILRTPGGLTGLMGYDPGVYYAAGDALAHGRLPYRDFLFLHPPGVLLVTTPFSMLGQLTTDEIGFVAAVLGFIAIGALNAALVVIAARRFGLPDRAATTGGLVYAVWFGAAGAEVTVHLEQLGTLAFLGCLICLAPPAANRLRTLVFAGGACAALACTVKIWWSVPLLVVLLWLGIRSRRWAAVGWFAGGAGCALAVIAGPFFVAAPSAMWRMVVVDQLSRARGPTLLQRAAEITNLDKLFGSHVTALHVALVVVTLLCLAVGALAWHSRVRLPVVLVVAQLLVLAVAPSFFSFYADYVAAAVALTVAAATSVVLSARWLRAALVGISAAASVSAVVTGLSADVSQPFPATQLRSGVAQARCVMSDSPGALIELDALSRGLAAGCPYWIDVTGLTYDADRAPVPRVENVRWQRDILRYLRSGDAVVLARPATGIDAATRRKLGRDCVLAAAGTFRAYRTSDHPHHDLSMSACRESLEPVEPAASH